MELKQLEYFMVTCEKGSFNKAAEWSFHEKYKINDRI